MLTRLLALCGCSSTLELLVGQPGSCDSDTGARDNHLTSPYVSMTTRAETTTDERSTHETVAAMPNETSVVESEREKEVQNNKSVFSGGIMKPLLKLLRSRLTRETWKAQPTAKHALMWTLKQLKVRCIYSWLYWCVYCRWCECMYGSCIAYSVCVCIVLILNSISYTDGEYDFVDRSSCIMYCRLITVCVIIIPECSSHPPSSPQ